MSDTKLTASQLYDMANAVDRHNRTAQRLGEIAAAAEKKKRMRRFTWCRDHHAIMQDDRWRLVAQMAGSPLHLVEAFQRRLDAYANTNEPRGSLAGFSIAALAAAWSIPNADLLARIYAAMETPEVGWIDQEFLTTFWERNPDHEDPTAAERMRRMRALRKEANAPKSRSSPLPESVTRNNRNVTTRADQIFTKRPVDNCGDVASGAIQGLSEGQRGDDGADKQTAAVVWLASEGERIVTERMMMARTLAATRIARWLEQQLGGDAVALAEIIHAADATDYIGPRFHNLVVDSLKRAPRQAAAQAELRLPPVIASERKLG